MRLTEEYLIAAQDGDYWVARDRSRRNGYVYSVVRDCGTHGKTDSTYADLSLALARMRYLAKRDKARGDEETARLRLIRDCHDTSDVII